MGHIVRLIDVKRNLLESYFKFAILTRFKSPFISI